MEHRLRINPKDMNYILQFEGCLLQNDSVRMFLENSSQDKTDRQGRDVMETGKHDRVLGLLRDFF